MVDSSLDSKLAAVSFDVWQHVLCENLSSRHAVSVIASALATNCALSASA
jgi:hypothetical protein